MLIERCVLLFAVLHQVACSGGGNSASTQQQAPPTPSPPPAPEKAPPPSEAAKQTIALVDKAVALVERDGKAALSEFRKPGTEWFHDSTYLFAYDMELTVLLNPAFPKREGTRPRGEKDRTGKMFHDEILSVGSKGSGWVDVLFPKPGTTEPVLKWVYVKGVKLDGAPAMVIGSGFYPE